MLDIFADFHFLRPAWLYLLLLLPFLIWMRYRLSEVASSWKGVVDQELFEVLVPQSSANSSKWIWVIGLSVGILLTAVALAGPAWDRVLEPVYKDENAMVIVLDLSPSMTAEDISPSRIERSKLKIQEILKTREDGFTSIVAYAGDAHIVAPITDDVSTLLHLLRFLHPAMMPMEGSNTKAGIELAQTLLKQSAYTEGQILLLTDGVSNTDSVKSIHKDAYPVSILGVGTPLGAPFPRTTYLNDHSEPSKVYTNDGSIAYYTNEQGKIVTATVDRYKLRQLARTLGGSYSDMTLDNSDIDSFVEPQVFSQLQEQENKRFDAWFDYGAWFAIPLVFLLLPTLRRGTI